MSVVTLQIGQCGNQVGRDWYKILARELGLDKPFSRNDSAYVNEGLKRWFYTDGNRKYFARAVLIDTEPKVVREACRKTISQFWKYHPSSVVCWNAGGSGNNWALGHYCRGYEMQEAILNCVRKEVENCERLSTFHNILSCAGGTGSGLGSYIIACLRDEYPTKCMINSLILPFQGGEIITQNYNTVLTFSKLYNISNVHVIFENDNLHETCCSLSGDTCIRLNDLNSLISLKLASFLQPVKNLSKNYLPSIISDLTPHPCLKMVSVENTPHFPPRSVEEDCSLSWKVLVKRLLRSLRRSTCCEETISDGKLENSVASNASQKSPKYEFCIANTLITRGDEGVNNEDIKGFRSQKLYPEDLPVGSGFHHLHQKEKFFKMHKSATLISNNSSLHSSVNGALKKAWAQFSQKAHLHHYTKYGLEEEEIVQAFVKVEDIVENYRELNEG